MGKDRKTCNRLQTDSTCWQAGGGEAVARGGAAGDQEDAGRQTPTHAICCPQAAGAVECDCCMKCYKPVGPPPVPLYPLLKTLRQQLHSPEVLTPTESKRRRKHCPAGKALPPASRHSRTDDAAAVSDLSQDDGVSPYSQASRARRRSRRSSRRRSRSCRLRARHSRASPPACGDHRRIICAALCAFAATTTVPP